MKQSCTILNFPAEIKVMALLENEKSYEIKITVADLEGKEILYGNGCFTAPSVDSKVTAQCCVCMIPVQNYGTGNVYLKIFHPQNSTVELSEHLMLKISMKGNPIRISRVMVVEYFILVKT